MTTLTGSPAPATGFDPTLLEVQRDPYPHYHWLLRHDPVHRGAQDIWYVSRYPDVRRVMGDPVFGRAGIRDFWGGLMGPGPLAEILRHTIFFQDPPDHDRLRELLAPAFAPRVVRTLESTVEEIAEELLRPLLRRGRMDLVADFSYPLALSVISRVLGVPAADRPRLRAWTVAIAPTLDLAATPDEIARGQAAMGEFVDYLRTLLAGRPGGLLELMRDATTADTTGPARASIEEVLATAVTLAFAGHDTVTNQIGNGVLTLLRHPEQLDLLRRDPGLLPGAVEEMLRYDSSVQSNSRLLLDDVDLHGRRLRRGEVVVALVGAANRDPDRFTDPDRFDVTRANVQPMSFGAGIRFCLGAMLARLELRAAFSRLVHLPDLRLAVPEDHLVRLRSTMFRGVTSLPLTFRPAG